MKKIFMTVSLLLAAGFTSYALEDWKGRVTDIPGTVLGTSGTVLEMLGKVPGMMAKGNELEVIGKGAPVIYINGRKLRDMNELKLQRAVTRAQEQERMPKTECNYMVSTKCYICADFFY